jgi:glycogen operon protein
LARLNEGLPEPLGATPDATGCNFAVYSEHATAIEVCLFDGEAESRFTLPGRSGAVFHGHIAGVKPGARYGLRAHGPFEPAKGQRFDPTKLLVDPYARRLEAPLVLHPAMMPPAGGETGPLVARALVTPEPKLAIRKPLTSWAKSVIYETSVRAFTKTHPSVPEVVRGTFAGLAHPAAIEHLTRLGGAPPAAARPV